MPRDLLFSFRKLDDGRLRVLVLDKAAPIARTYNPKTYTQVSNIDGSCQFMLDDGLWTFLPLADAEFMGPFQEALAHFRSGMIDPIADTLARFMAP